MSAVMKSPFPGMDPYLERHWRDVHSRLVLYAADQIEEQLPGKLIARVEERIVVEPDEGESRAFFPDVRIEEEATALEHAAVAVVDERKVATPVIVHYEEPTETYLTIIDPSNNKLVTVIEMLSPTNKLPGDGQTQYRQKQRELKSANVNLVEVDLLRTGKRSFSLPSTQIPRKVKGPYQVCVRRASTGSYEVYSAPLRRPLPVIAIPLRENDHDVQLDLQALLDQVYRKGRYYLSIDYAAPPAPPLEKPDATWADELLHKAGKR